METLTIIVYVLIISFLVHVNLADLNKRNMTEKRVNYAIESTQYHIQSGQMDQERTLIFLFVKKWRYI